MIRQNLVMDKLAQPDQPRRFVWLPGMSGMGEFWAPVASRVAGEHTLVDFPGLGMNLANPRVNSYEDLVDDVAAKCLGPSVLVAQSMGGVVAMHLALRYPELVTHLVLAATSGGIDITPYRAEDWRISSRLANPSAPGWAFADQTDLSPRLPNVHISTLLIWASDDAISPVGVGQRLNELLPNSQLLVLESDDHWVARIEAEAVANRIVSFLA
jgi:poly(3-hydroxyoctanoate) depolymerase